MNNMSSTTTLTALLSLLLATSAFLVIAVNQPTAPITIDEESAINIIKESGKTDPRIVYGSSPVNAQQEYIKPNWMNILGDGGSRRHSRIYLSPIDGEEVKPYWVIEYETELSPLPGMWTGFGRYVVDAQTGELVLSLEEFSGGIMVAGRDYQISTKPVITLWDTTPANTTDGTLIIKIGKSTPLSINIASMSYYDASLPVSLRVVGVSKELSASQDVTSATLVKGGSVSFTLNIFAPDTDLPEPEYPILRLSRIDFEIDFMGSSTSYSVNVLRLLDRP